MVVLHTRSVATKFIGESVSRVARNTIAIKMVMGIVFFFAGLSTIYISHQAGLLMALIGIVLVFVPAELMLGYCIDFKPRPPKKKEISTSDSSQCSKPETQLTEISIDSNSCKLTPNAARRKSLVNCKTNLRQGTAFTQKYARPTNRQNRRRSQGYVGGRTSRAIHPASQNSNEALIKKPPPLRRTMSEFQPEAYSTFQKNLVMLPEKSFSEGPSLLGTPDDDLKGSMSKCTFNETSSSSILQQQQITKDAIDSASQCEISIISSGASCSTPVNATPESVSGLLLMPDSMQASFKMCSCSNLNVFTDNITVELKNHH